MWPASLGSYRCCDLRIRCPSFTEPTLLYPSLLCIPRYMCQSASYAPSPPSLPRRIVLRSTGGPIDVYIIQNTNNVGTTSQQGAAPSASPEPAGSTVGSAGAGAGSASAAGGGGGAAAAGGAASGARATAAGAVAAGGPSAPPTVVKPDFSASMRAPGSAMAGHGKLGVVPLGLVKL